jgi:hypothetical protein
MFRKTNTVGGSPTASHFLLLRQKESNQRKGDPSAPLLRSSLRCSTGQAAAELARSATRPRAQTVLADYPLTSLRYSAAHKGKKVKTLKPQDVALRAHPASLA